MVYVGANDGMLHAFNLGVLSVVSSGFQKGSLSGTNLGKEQWAYIPKSALPFLKYMADSAYGHLYYVDGRTVIFDASIGDTNSGDCVKSTYWKCDKPSVVVDSAKSLDATKNTWRSVVISGMGIGGASAMTCAVGANCVQTPATDPADASKGFGYSSYFALDVTDPNNPSLLWEFSDPALGYATTGPAVIRLGPDSKKNGRWFAIFGSGPTGPIDTGTHLSSTPGTNLRLVCTLPDSEEFVSGTGASPAHVQDKTVTLDTLPVLAPKAVAAWRIVVKALKADDARFKVGVSSDQFEKPINKDESTQLY